MRRDLLAVDYTEQKADMVMRLIRNVVNPLTCCHHKRCQSYSKHEHTPGCMYSSVIFIVRLNCDSTQDRTVEFLREMENHGKFFHCRIGGMILLHEHLAKKE